MGGGVNYNGGREFHSLIAEGKKQKFVTINHCGQLAVISSSQWGIDRAKTIIWYSH